ncbi:MAG: hypothetical protein FJ044_00965 [Candidatus Cloacimonetes bacterium]|nr:hypothetical protein [Candidatus Cloacimonadota bacterium]
MGYLDFDYVGDYYDDFEFEETEFSKNARRPFMYKGVRYVFKTNTEKGSEFHNLHKQLQRAKRARIKFRMRAYSAYAVGPKDTIPNHVAVFVAEEDLPIVIETVDKLTQELVKQYQIECTST